MTEKIGPGVGDAGPEKNSVVGSLSNNTATPACASPLKFHPLADIFPLMEGKDFDALVADIKANGPLERIVLYEGLILDGRNRYRALLAAGLDPAVANRFTVDGTNFVDDPAAYVVSANLHRRHLTREQKCELIARLLKKKPEASNRSIAKQLKVVTDKTVGAVRRAEEATAEIPQLEKTVGADGKTRKRPANKAAPKTKSKPASKPPRNLKRELEAKDAHIAEIEAAREHDLSLAEKLRAAEIKIAGLESEIQELKAENAELRAKLAGGAS
jgi:hypothetical protein